MFLDMARILREITGNSIALYAQDPDFRELDGMILAKLQMRVQEAPEAEDLCGADVFYCVPYSGREHYFLRQNHPPAIMVGLSYEHLERNIVDLAPIAQPRESTNLQLQQVRAVEHHYHRERIMPGSEEAQQDASNILAME